jgi:glycosyltransferase involved in cell wall biosynthesis
MMPARALAAQGADVHITTTGPMIVWNDKWEGRPGPNHRALGLFEKYDADVIVMQRPGQRWWADIIPFLHEQGIRVVVDVDDRFDAIPENNHAFRGYQGSVVNHEHIDRACQLADAVTTTTRSLLKRYGYGKGFVLPNLVPESYFDVFGLKREKTIGWSGFVGMHPNDLQETRGTIQAAMGDWRFHVIGDGRGVRQALRLDEEPTSTGWLDFSSYAYALAELEVGIVPLERSLFNQGKSALKASEMAALGVPVVMSPTPDNMRLHKLGVGLVADGQGQWRRLVSKLVNSEAMRTELSESGRAIMETQTYERHCERWLDVWTGKMEAAA